jgi:8-oxo-dGTP diphosphatase
LNHDKPRPAVHVVAAAVIDETERVLIAQRPHGKHLAGGWEFPGGKLEPGENRRAGLARELREEIGIEIATPRPLLRLRHTYPSGEVLLDMWVVRHYTGEPQNLDGQALRWVNRDELTVTELLPADKPIVAALRLPERLTQTSTPDYTIHEAFSAAADARLRGAPCGSFPEAVAAADLGADFIVLREALSHSELAAICELVFAPVYAHGLDLEAAWDLGATGTNEITD